MARTGFIHHFGTFLLFSATVLLIITCISAPVVRSIALLKVELPGGNINNNGDFSFVPNGLDDRSEDDPSITFGVFGYCLNGAGGNQGGCPRSLGYSPLAVIENIVGPNRGQSGNPNFSPDQTFGEFYSDNSERTARALTKAMVLHPIAAAFNFLAFILALGAGMLGSLLASLVALLAFVITAVVCIIDFVLFGIVRSNLSNGRDGDDDGLGLQVQRVYYDNAAWMTLAAAVLSLVGAIVVFFSCCSGRIHKRRERKRAIKGDVPVTDYGTPAPPRRRRWF